MRGSYWVEKAHQLSTLAAFKYVIVKGIRNLALDIRFVRRPEISTTDSWYATNFSLQYVT